MPSKVEPISPKVTIEDPNPPDVSHLVAELNEKLAPPWEESERQGGRFLERLTQSSATDRQRLELLRLFKAQGWSIRVDSSPKNETYWVVKPPRYR